MIEKFHVNVLSASCLNCTQRSLKLYCPGVGKSGADDENVCLKLFHSIGGCRWHFVNRHGNLITFVTDAQSTLVWLLNLA